MQPSLFYCTESEAATPLLFLNQAYQADDGQALSEFEKNRLQAQNFKGKSGDFALMTDAEGRLLKIYVGMGDGSDSDALAHVVNRLPEGVYASERPLSDDAQLVWSLAQYRFDAYKPSSMGPKQLLVSETAHAALLAEAEAVFLVRDLINRPANLLGPKELAVVLSDLAEQYNGQFQQWVGAELLAHRFPAIYAVGAAAAAEPRLLSLSWGEPQYPLITLVGKGVCFDSGGLDVKPAPGMRFMKKDMGGAAHVIGLAQWLMSQSLKIRLQVLIPAVENAIGSRSYRPGDVITMRNGLTVEVDNTDAEGRLILADALVKACEAKPDLLFNFATLTGAARVAVGTEMAAMFTESEALANDLMGTADRVQDPIWRLPLYPGYAAMLDSGIADLANASASPYAGAILAALFLQRFIDKAVPWVHFDMMAWNVSGKPGKPEGGEAMGMRAVAHYLFQRYGTS